MLVHIFVQSLNIEGLSNTAGRHFEVKLRKDRVNRHLLYSFQLSIIHLWNQLTGYQSGSDLVHLTSPSWKENRVYVVACR